MPYLFRWRTRADVSELEQTSIDCATENIKLRRQLSGKQQFINRLEFLVQQRSNTIDDQRGRLEQLRATNRQLDEEAEHYAQIIRMS